MSKGSPSPPDPVRTAEAQAAANAEAVRESALVNQINQVTPFGTETFTGEIGSPDRTRTVALGPQDQANLETQRRVASGLFGLGENALLPQVGSALGSELDFSGLPGTLTPQQFSFAGIQNPSQIDFSTLGQNLAGTANELEQATFQRGLNLIQPGLEQGRRDLETQLANQGIPRGSEAFNEAIGNFERSQQQQLENLALSSVGAGRAEQSRLFGLDLAGRQSRAGEQSRFIGLQQALLGQQGGEQSRAFGLQQAARQQGLSELLAQRSQPINELSALLQGAPAIGSPQFAPPAQFGVAPPDIAGLQSQDFAARSAQSQRQQSDLLGGLFGLGSSFILA